MALTYQGAGDGGGGGRKTTTSIKKDPFNGYLKPKPKPKTSFEKVADVKKQSTASKQSTNTYKPRTTSSSSSSSKSSSSSSSSSKSSSGSSNSGYTANGSMRIGARGGNVTELQKYLGISADGIFGPQTQQAVRNYQKKMGLTVDGIVGPKTWAALRGGGSSSKSSSGGSSSKGSSGSTSTKTNTQNVSTSKSYTPKPIKPSVSDADKKKSQQAVEQAGKAYYDMATKYMNNIDALMSKGFDYNPEKDPKYIAAKKIAGKEAEGAKMDAMETMNDRGIMNSSITASQLGQIEQDAADHILSLIPGFEANARADYNDKYAQMSDFWKTTLAQGNNSRDFAEDKRRFEQTFGLEQDKFNFDQSRWGAEFDFAQDKWGQEFGFTKDKWDQEFGFTKDKWGAEFDFTKSQANVENNLKQQGINLDAQQVEIQRLANQSDMEYREFQKQQGISAKQGEVATNGYVSTLLGYADADSAIEYIVRNASTIANDGANMGAIIDALEYRFPGASSVVTGQTGGASGGAYTPPR